MRKKERAACLEMLSALAGGSVQVVAVESLGGDWAPVERWCLQGAESIGLSVVIKTRRHDEAGWGGNPLNLIAEHEALAAIWQSGLTIAPTPIAWNEANGILIMQDLAPAQAIERLLFGVDPSVAEAALVAKHGTYIVCPIDRIDGDRRLNSAVLIDRSGEIAAIYDKVYPYWAEFDLSPSVDVGTLPVVAETDFGRVGLAICFDVNFPPLWQAMANEGADLVVWPSAYSAGSALQAHAIMHHYHILTSTQYGDCQIFDLTGERILDERSDGINVSRATLDLDRGIYLHNFNLRKRDQLLQDRPGDVEEEAFFPREHRFVLRGDNPDVSVRELAREYGLEELRDYKSRSWSQIDAMRVES